MADRSERRVTRARPSADTSSARVALREDGEGIDDAVERHSTFLGLPGLVADAPRAAPSRHVPSAEQAHQRHYEEERPSPPTVRAARGAGLTGRWERPSGESAPHPPPCSIGRLQWGYLFWGGQRSGTSETCEGGQRGVGVG